MLHKGDPPYNGSVSKAGFTIIRNINYRNSFKPAIYGEFEPAPFGSRIRVTMRPMVPAYVLMVLWNLGLGVGAIVIVVSAVHEPRALAGLAVVAALLMFGLAITFGSFGYEAARTEDFLRSVFPPARGPRNLGPYREIGHERSRKLRELP